MLDYEQALGDLEALIWTSPFLPERLNQYQKLSREMEQDIASSGHDPRHAFVIIIPVADRPQHLDNILASLLTLCRHFNYGGQDQAGQYQKIRVIIADDSQQSTHIKKHQAQAKHYSSQGLSTEYFGIPEQLDELGRLDDTQQASVESILGNIDPAAFYHKGASITRNLVYLKLNRLKTSAPTLFYFVDSDQEFCVKGHTDDGDKTLYSINYFHHLDRVFSRTDTQILTGKVVGDPPVSPSVMAANFQDDVSSFLEQMTRHSAQETCSFHQPHTQQEDQAAYHDMASLFGFDGNNSRYQYHCTLSGEHDHQQCFADFANKLSHFFDGEHPTRITYFQHQEVMRSLAPARTIYTGNYVFKPEALKHFIPFATLRLRMAGPVLGRLLQTQLGPRFKSANLPMLHLRTVETTGESEFRPGIERSDNRVELGGEFERQFFGDVMLFTVIELGKRGYPQRTPDRDKIIAILAQTETRLLGQYRDKQRQILENADRLEHQLKEAGMWWQEAPSSALFFNFLRDIRHNFGQDAKGYRLIQKGENRDRRMAEMAEAIGQLNKVRHAWERLLTEESGT